MMFDLGDAMHNISAMLDDEGWIDDKEYRSLYLNIYDRNWAEETGLCLSDFIESRIERHLTE